MQENSKEHITVWDLPLRLFHWLLVSAVIGGIVTGKMDILSVHEHFGMAVMGLVCFRLLWGVTGSQTARFSRFMRPPQEALAMLARIRRGEADNHAGHSALGGYATLLLLTVTLIMSLSGSFSSDDVLYEGPFVHLWPAITGFAGQLHDITEKFLFLVIALHIAALLVYYFRLKKNLVPAMFTGKRQGATGNNGHISRRHTVFGLILLGLCLGLFQSFVLLRPSLF